MELGALIWKCLCLALISVSVILQFCDAAPFPVAIHPFESELQNEDAFLRNLIETAAGKEFENRQTRSSSPFGGNYYRFFASPQRREAGCRLKLCGNLLGRK